MFLLMFLVQKVGTSSCPASDAFLVPHEWYQPGDFTIGGMASHMGYHFYAIKFVENPALIPYDIPFILTKFHQHALALAFAVKEINEGSQILPNVTLGFHIYDSYLSAGMTYRTTLDLLFKSQEFVPNYKCDRQKNLMAIIGGLGSDTSSNIAEVVDFYKIPQLTYGSLPQEKFQTSKHSSLYFMAPEEDHQYIGIIQLLQHFRWTWIGIFTMDDNNGERFLQKMQLILSQNGICSSFTRRLLQLIHFEHYVKLYDTMSDIFTDLRNSDTTTFLVYGEPLIIMSLRAIMFVADPESKETSLFRKVWIMTAQIDFVLSGFQVTWDLHMFHGAISFSVHSRAVAGFKDFLQTINPLSGKRDGFLQDIWEQSFDCSFSKSELEETSNRQCSVEKKLEDLPGPVFEMEMTGHSYGVYNAVYAVAHALQALFMSGVNQKQAMMHKITDLPHLQPWQLHRFLHGISFNNSAGEKVSLNEKGEVMGGFDIINLITFPNRSFQRVRVGRIDPSSPTGKELFMDEDLIVWHPVFNQAWTHLMGQILSYYESRESPCFLESC